TYITPAPFVQGVWVLIFTRILVVSLCTRYWFGASDDLILHGFRSNFVLASLLTAVWAQLWDSDHTILAYVALTVAVAFVTMIYHNITTHFPAKTWPQTLFVHTPISVSHAWLLFVMFLNSLAMTSDYDPKRPDAFHQLLAFFVLAQLTFTAVAYTEYKSAIGDVPCAFTIAWALFGVTANQKSDFISNTAAVFGIIVVCYAIR
ncbi:hypothetical protein BDK51DRAFT_3127, partial [Blyttiomyces helicus]